MGIIGGIIGSIVSSVIASFTGPIIEFFKTHHANAVAKQQANADAADLGNAKTTEDKTVAARKLSDDTF